MSLFCFQKCNASSFLTPTLQDFTTLECMSAQAARYSWRPSVYLIFSLVLTFR